VAGCDAKQLGGAWRGNRDERLELCVEVGDLLVKEGDPTGVGNSTFACWGGCDSRLLLRTQRYHG